ncbi:glycosyltransferase domain protein [Synechococcus sp. RS9915]|nr:glycosyltransferase domain protein [Synechococcus sp. RS9915]
MIIHFSLVTYFHSLLDIDPLLNSLNSLNSLILDNNLHGHIITLSVFDNSATPLFCENQLRSLLSPLIQLYYHTTDRNIGFGAGHNYNFYFIDDFIESNSASEAAFFIPINPDISFDSSSFLPLLAWFAESPNPCCSPLVLNNNNQVQMSAKHNPTFLSLLAGRFSILRFIPYISKYMQWHCHSFCDYYNEIIEAEYLSGCIMLIKYDAYLAVGGFGGQYFLHLEDADITRKLSVLGPCVHNPIGVVSHAWARGSHKNLVQMFLLLKSYFAYVRTWGFRLL